MTIRRLTHRVESAQAGQRLDFVTLQWLQPALGRRLSKSTVRRLIMAGAIQVNGRPTTRPGLMLLPDARMAATIDEGRLPRPETGTIGVGSIPVLFEDEALIAVAKPPDLPVHATADAARTDLYTLVRRQLARDRGATAGPPQDAAARTDLPYLGLHHRLDLDTSGVVLFTKVREANAGLAAQFESRSIDKLYHALTSRAAGTIQERWHVENRLASVGRGKSARMAGVSEGGQAATTEFSVLERWPSALLVEARPHTGRKHQIRVHLGERGTPILGDARYGGVRRLGDLVIPRPMLHARALAFDHPISGRRLVIDCDYPEDFLRVLRHLRARASTRAPAVP